MPRAPVETGADPDPGTLPRVRSPGLRPASWLLAPDPATAHPGGGEPIWLEPRPEAVKRLRLGLWLAGLLFALVAALLGVIAIRFGARGFVAEIVPPVLAALIAALAVVLLERSA